MTLRLGQTFIHGRSRAQAQSIMAACATLGIDKQVIRATDSGFIVPNAVAEEIERANRPAWSHEEAVF